MKLPKLQKRTMPSVGIEPMDLDSWVQHPIHQATTGPPQKTLACHVSSRHTTKCRGGKVRNTINSKYSPSPLLRHWERARHRSALVWASSVYRWRWQTVSHRGWGFHTGWVPAAWVVKKEDIVWPRQIGACCSKTSPSSEDCSISHQSTTANTMSQLTNLP